MSHQPLYRRWPVVVILALFSVVFGGEVLSQPESGPQPPCGKEVFPAYPDLDKPPTVRVWDRSDLGPPACTGWTTPGFTTLVVTVGRFRHTSGVEGLLHRIVAVSELAGMRYWSTTHKRWQTLIFEAYALPGLTDERRRNDFTLDEIAEGKSLYFHQEDNLSGKANYRMRIRSASPDLAVFDTENISSIRYRLLPLFQAGELQSIYFFERESQDVWRYYSIVRMGKNASLLTTGHDASSINRAVAFYRYLSGIPTDQEPPASP